jgi:hypothetical protein
VNLCGEPRGCRMRMSLCTSVHGGNNDRGNVGSPEEGGCACSPAA